MENNIVRCQRIHVLIEVCMLSNTYSVFLLTHPLILLGSVPSVLRYALYTLAVNGQSDDTTNTTTIASPTEDVTTTTPNTTLTTPEVTTNHSLTASVSTQEPNTTVPTTAPTTTASVVTTVGPPSKPTVGKWRVNDTTHVCIMVNMAVQLALKYKDDSGKVSVPNDIWICFTHVVPMRTQRFIM